MNIFAFPNENKENVFNYVKQSLETGKYKRFIITNDCYYSIAKKGEKPNKLPSQMPENERQEAITIYAQDDTGRCVMIVLPYKKIDDCIVWEKEIKNKYISKKQIQGNIPDLWR